MPYHVSIKVESAHSWGSSSWKVVGTYVLLLDKWRMRLKFLDGRGVGHDLLSLISCDFFSQVGWRKK